MPATAVKRTYSSRNSRKMQRHLNSSPPPSSPPPAPARSSGLIPSSPPSSPVPAPALGKRKRILEPLNTVPSSNKRLKKHAASTTTKKQMTQLHLDFAQPTLCSCNDCGLSYTIGAPEDESLHRAHCARVKRGMEWDEKSSGEVTEIRTRIPVKGEKNLGRIVCFRGDVGGKLGSKLSTLLHTIELALSSPPISPDILKSCKAYFFLLPNQKKKERIIGCILAQHIEWAMELDEETSSTIPTKLPSSLGISRIFVASSHRRRGVASSLLDAAADTFIHACPLSPARGEVAFSQPTESGGLTMKAWGKKRGGAVRVYDEWCC